MSKKDEDKVTVTIAGLQIKELATKINTLLIITFGGGFFYSQAPKEPPKPSEKPVTVKQHQEHQKLENKRWEAFLTEYRNDRKQEQRKIDFLYQSRIQELQKKKYSYRPKY